MKGDNSHVRRKSGPQVRAFKREAIAYAIGRTEEWVRGYAESVQIPFETVASGVSLALGGEGNRSAMSLLQVRDTSARPPEVLQPAVAVDRRSRKSVQTRNGRARGTKPLAEKTVKAIVRARAAGESGPSIARRLGISSATVYRLNAK